MITEDRKRVLINEYYRAILTSIQKTSDRFAEHLRTEEQQYIHSMAIEFKIDEIRLGDLQNIKETGTGRIMRHIKKVVH